MSNLEGVGCKGLTVLLGLVEPGPLLHSPTPALAPGRESSGLVHPQHGTKLARGLCGDDVGVLDSRCGTGVGFGLEVKMHNQMVSPKNIQVALHRLSRSYFGKYIYIHTCMQ